MPTAIPLSEAKQALLDRYLRGVASDRAETIHRRAPGSDAPLSAAQEELYRRELRVAGMPPLYNECITLCMAGPVDVISIERAFNEIVKRHEAWRTTFETKGVHPVQVVHPATAHQLPVIDLLGSPEAESEAAVARLIGEEVRRPFDLGRGPLLRAKLVRLSENDHRLFLIAHQIILDGVSAYQIFPSELAAFYKEFSAGRAATLPELQVQCADFACWQREWLSGVVAKQVDYWHRQLGDGLPALSWPGKPRPATPSFRGTIQSFSFPRPLSDHIKDLGRQLSTTLFVVLLAGFATVLHRYTKQKDIVLGTLSPSGRKRSEVMGLLGYFLNPVALKLSFHDGMTLRELVLQAQRVLLEAMCNDDVPIERVAGELGVSDGVTPSPFFTAAVSLQPPMPNLDLPWTVTSMDVESGGSPWDFYLAFIDRPEGLIGRAQFIPDRFDKATTDAALQDLQKVLGNALPDSVVSSERILADQESATRAAGVTRSTV